MKRMFVSLFVIFPSLFGQNKIKSAGLSSLNDVKVSVLKTSGQCKSHVLSDNLAAFVK